MRLVFDALGISAASYDWYVSDIETNYYGEDFASEDQWILVEDLQRFLENNEVQFIWAVFSAVPKGFRTTVEKHPYVEGNTAYWNRSEMRPQLPGALFEIACWDSSATLLIGMPDDMLKNFCCRYSDTKPLVDRPN